MKQPKLLGEASAVFSVDSKFCQDINTEYDWCLAELKVKLARELEQMRCDNVVFRVDVTTRLGISTSIVAMC